MILTTKDCSEHSPPDTESYLEKKTALESNHQMQNHTQNKREFWSPSTRMQNHTQNKRQFWSLTTRCRIILTRKDSSRASLPDAESYLQQKTVLEPHHQMQRLENCLLFWECLCMWWWELSFVLRVSLSYSDATKDSSGASSDAVLRTKDSSGASSSDAETLSEQKTVLKPQYQMQNHTQNHMQNQHQQNHTQNHMQNQHLQNHTQNERQFWSLTTRCRIILRTKDSSGASAPDAESYLEKKTQFQMQWLLEPQHQMQNHT